MPCCLPCPPLLLAVPTSAANSTALLPHHWFSSAVAQELLAYAPDDEAEVEGLREALESVREMASVPATHFPLSTCPSLDKTHLYTRTSTSLAAYTPPPPTYRFASTHTFTCAHTIAYMQHVNDEKRRAEEFAQLRQTLSHFGNNDMSRRYLRLGRQGGGTLWGG